MAPSASSSASMHGVQRKLILLAWVGNFAGGLFAVAYGVAALRVSAVVMGSYFAITFGAVAACMLAVSSSARRNMPSWRRFEKAEALSPELLRTAAAEVFRLPDTLFVVHSAVGIVVALVGGLAVTVVGGLGWEFGSSCLPLCLLVGPVGAIVSYLFVLRAARSTLARLGDFGLAPQQLADALRNGKTRLRGKVAILTGVAVVVPAVLVAGAVEARAWVAYGAMAELSTAAEQQALAQEFGRPLSHLSLILLGLMCVAFSLAIASWAARSITGPLARLALEAQRIADGKLSGSRPVFAEDEVWVLASSLVTVEWQLAAAIAEMRGAGMRISSTTEQLLSSSVRHEAGSNEQAAALNETSATTEELARSARQIAENATDVATMAEQTLNAAQVGRRSSEAFFASMSRMKADNQAVADSVVRLNKRVQQIGKVVEFIHEIADKSDLLALNAELEGTKAGDVGRGFSLVAAEMRRLAESVIVSTREIEKLIDEVRDATNAAVMATEAGVKATDSGAALANHLSDSLRGILTLAENTSGAVRSISLATQQQQTGTDQLAEAMNGILAVTYEGNEATREILRANTDLLSLSKDLQQLAETFQLAGQSPSTSTNTGTKQGQA